MNNRLSIFAPAKLNLFLKVHEKQLDGYHRLETVFQSIDLYDHLTFELFVNNPELPDSINSSVCNVKIDLTKNPQSHLVPIDKSNLIYQAVRVFAKKAKLPKFTLHVQLDKRIPVAGGLAGGSANAAATLYALNYLFGEPLEQGDLLLLALELGSDVPFCLLGGSMLGTGRGDQLTRLPELQELLCVLVFPPPDVTLSTKEVYATFDKLSLSRPKDDVVVEKFLEILLTKKSDIFKYLYNSLEEASVSLSYWVDKAKSTIDSKGFTSLVSGSGPSVFTIAPNEAQALNLIRELEDEGYHAAAFRAINEPFHVIAH